MVRSIMIVEMAGRPPEHVRAALEQHVGVLNQVKDLKVHTIKASQPKEIENSGGIFTCFAEVDFETESFSRLSEIMFDFMPSSVEVIEPAKVTLDAGEASGLLNNLSGRLHRYDELAKIAHFRIQQLTTELEASKNMSAPGKAEKTASVKGAEKKVGAKVKKAEKKKGKK